MSSIDLLIKPLHEYIMSFPDVKLVSKPDINSKRSHGYCIDDFKPRFVAFEPKVNFIKVKLDFNGNVPDYPTNLCKPTSRNNWNCQCDIKSLNDFEKIKPLIKHAYNSKKEEIKEAEH